MKNKNQVQKHVIEAAGGVVWKNTSSGPKLAIIHRRRYDDWSLPKGKRETGEQWHETAIREVFEETGCQVTLGKFIGSTSYLLKNYSTPKIVLFWNMHTINETTFQPSPEVDRLKWVSPHKALKKLSFPNEQEIIRKALNQSRTSREAS